MFSKLCDTRVWDCLNFFFLKYIVDNYLYQSEECKALNKELEEHSKKVNMFMEKSKLVEFLDIYWEFFPNVAQQSKMTSNSLKAKLTGNLENMTLSEFHHKKHYLEAQFRLHHNVLRICTANSGCIILCWYVPKYAVQHIKDICKELQPDFGQAGFIELCIDDYILYQVCLSHIIMSCIIVKPFNLCFVKKFFYCLHQKLNVAT